MRIRTFVVLAIGIAAVVAACSGSSGSSAPSAASGAGLTGKTWHLTAITEKVPAFQGVVPAAEQANYTIEFKSDGTLQREGGLQPAGGHLHHDPERTAWRSFPGR